MAVSCLVTGVLIDLDHVVDYIFQGGRLFRIREFFQVYHAGQLLKVRIFHGWEWLGLLGAAAWMAAGGRSTAGRGGASFATLSCGAGRKVLKLRLYLKSH